MKLNVALLGFGNVGRALAELLLDRWNILRQDYDIDLRVVGISTGSHGHVINPAGLDLRAALEIVRAGERLDVLHEGQPPEDTSQFLAECPADLIFESIPTNPHNGQPAYAYLFGALERGIHVVTSNKGPVAFGYRELSALAERQGIGFFFESTVMDGAPVLAVGREGLPATRIERVRGIFNSTTNYILTRMEQELLSFEEALAAAQQIGIAETDPTLDIDGWDSAIKTVILANVLMGADLRPVDVDRRGIRDITLADVQEAGMAGERIRLICEAARLPDGSVSASVTPRRVPMDDILAGITGTTSLVEFETDTLRRLTLVEYDPGPDTTAYGMLADMINITRGRHRQRI
ncbi:MAG TPA: homoserine dehydrogenase [Chloroflexi bacterium]|nr:homoserine dehydrogenase [Chloroflexota bacterium]